MIRKYCDRCGKVFPSKHPLLDEQTQYVGGKIRFSIYRTSTIIGYPSSQIDLCKDCRSKLEQIITDFLDESKNIIEEEEERFRKEYKGE